MMWMSETPMPVWMRGRLALASARPQASMSLATARESAQMVGPVDFLADELERPRSPPARTRDIPPR